ncbi:MAG: DNA mismatch repair endonuclease MutL [Candidatus Latescibacteria bacterium]|nr:DNA mismatch repair endonuclease MutL [Candidatus Latescibacterota bacterium]
MPKIKILPDIVANKIAAGEVVERPASVVKELAENSVDAGASSIVVEIEGGGRRLVRVSDNGEGMSRDDALLCLERHATSKIASAEDIEHIVTLGFRGEAIPSIVSVSKAVIDTKRKDDMFGTRLIIQGGVLKNVTDIGRDKGTDVEIRNLFFNLPARRKFMKNEQTELRYIKSIIYETAIASPGLNLRLISDGKETFSYRGCTEREEMLEQIYGKTLANQMIPLNVSVNGVEIRGFVGKPETARTSGFNQTIVVNGRPVRSKSISRAILDGYGSTVAKGLFPAFVLYLETDPSRLDVNIHPAKREIRIHREYPVLESLRQIVSRVLQTMSAAPELGYSTPVTVYNPPPGSWHHETPRTFFTEKHSEQPPIQTGIIFTDNISDSQSANTEMRIEKDAAPFEGPAFWQLKDRYIITTVKEGAIIIDQHVAHERIIYEEVLEQLTGKPTASQQLLFPLTLDFSAADYDVFLPMIPFLNRIGFSVREFGERSVIVDAIPSGKARFEEGNIFFEYIDEMRIHGKISSGYTDKLAAAIACRSAIKAGKPLNQTEMQYLADRLFATKNPFNCPHGRPTIVKLTLDELDRRFGRT